MPSPVPRYLRTPEEERLIPSHLRGHVVDFDPDPKNGVKVPGAGRHRAKFAPGLSTELVRIANGSDDLGDPMAGTGMLAWETGAAMFLNDIDRGLSDFLDPLAAKNCFVTYQPAHEIDWKCDVAIFSPPYYPKADRRKPAGHNDEKRGPVVGFRDSYPGNHHPDFIGNPAGVEAIRLYREAMRRVYDHLTSVCSAMIVVTKNWTRLGTEMRLDLDTILMAMEAGWECVERHGWIPNPSLWSRYNASRGGGVQIEDVLVFEKAT
jgi:hypothetical protein